MEPLPIDHAVDCIVVEREELRESSLFDGKAHGGGDVSFILVDVGPGEGPALHRHAYQEIFIVQDGRATFTAGSTTTEIGAGQVVVVPGGVAHKFVNSGEGRLRQVDIHAAGRIVTEWIKE